MTERLTISSAAPASLVEASGPVATGTPTRLPDATPPGTPNPTLQLDPALGLVVMQFRTGDDGATTSIPTPRQLAAYRAGSADLPGHTQEKTA